VVVGEGVEEEAYIPEYLREYEVFHLERRLYDEIYRYARMYGVVLINGH